ncbi:unnamed protein product [Strongylus vulgaris]|uniref:Peptidase C1A papain C-terminal domain-containing protein n=1 Tax=Strongylus vulgaris TaxID=40348 RepID=A0A3P7IXX9_STRVU|nr:unnamed protein product [Strongylus vulgaris]
MSDRLCIASNEKNQTLISDTDIMSCCGWFCGDGCDGGYAMSAWSHVIRKGACTGGSYGQRNVCKPYPFRPCGHHTKHPIYEQCPKERQSTPKCSSKCSPEYNKTYKEDLIHAKKAHYLETSETEIQKEIMANGPVQATFKAYTDFLTYEKGIYKVNIIFCSLRNFP